MHRLCRCECPIAWQRGQRRNNRGARTLYAVAVAGQGLKTWIYAGQAHPISGFQVGDRLGWRAKQSRENLADGHYENSVVRHDPQPATAAHVRCVEAGIHGRLRRRFGAIIHGAQVFGGTSEGDTIEQWQARAQDESRAHALTISH